MKRAIYEVRWKKRWAVWTMGLRGTRQSLLNTYFTKNAAVSGGVWYARRQWKLGTPAQLVVFAKNGRICFERTYGRDPKRRKG